MGKKLPRKILDPLGLPDPLDVFGEKADAQAKALKEQEAQALALQQSQANSPTISSAETEAAREAERQRKLALSGQSSTVLTSGQGLGTTTGGGKTLLGS